VDSRLKWESQGDQPLVDTMDFVVAQVNVTWVELLQGLYKL
jgi:hypothetical protein